MTCATAGCSGDPLAPEIVEVFGAWAEGLCGECVAAHENAPVATTRRPGLDAEQVQDDPEIPETLDEIGVLADLSRDDDASGLLTEHDRALLDLILKAGRIKSTDLAHALGVHRTTVWRRVRALRLLGETRKDTSDRFHAIMQKRLRTELVGPGSPGAFQSWAEYQKVGETLTKRYAVKRRYLPPPVLRCRRDEDGCIVAEGRGPLPADLRQAIREGRAVWNGDPALCHECFRVLKGPGSAGGRRRRFCDERCRSRHRRSRVPTGN